MATLGQKEIKTNYPVVEGLEADQKHEGGEDWLVPEEASLVLKEEGKGLDYGR